MPTVASRRLKRLRQECGLSVRAMATFLETRLREVLREELGGTYSVNVGAGYVDRPIEQYAFRHPMETFCDLSYFHALIDRVGVYIGETWDGVPYKPLLDIATRVHKEELFHCTLGLRNLRLICKTPEGLAEANEKIHFWWPAALDMFGRSDSDFGDAYVRWGLRKKNNADLRRQYIADTRPLLDELGIEVPPNRLNRRFL